MKKDQLIKLAVITWLLGAWFSRTGEGWYVGFFSIFSWSCWLFFFLLAPIGLRFYFFKRPVVGLKHNIGLFLGSYVAVSLLTFTSMGFINLITVVGMLYIQIVFFFSKGNTLPHLYTLSSFFSWFITLLCLALLYRLHSGILRYCGETD